MADRPVIMFCLMVPSGSWDLAPLADAIRTHHSGARIVAVWCGDPHLRPVLGRNTYVSWADLDLADVGGIGWGTLLAGSQPRVYEWLRAAATTDRLLAGGASRVVVLRVGSVAVLGPCNGLTADGGPVALITRTDGSLPADGLAPADSDLIAEGRHGTAVAAFGGGSRRAIAWLIERLAEAPPQVGPVLDRMSEVFDVSPSSTVVASAGWSTSDDASIDVLDLDHLDRDEPWHFSFGRAPARIRLSEHAQLAAAVSVGELQIRGTNAAITLPGGVPLDEAIRQVVAEGISAWRAGEAPLPPEPFGPANSAFMHWLADSERWSADIGRYWLALRTQRADLQTVFARPQGQDASRFAEWSDTSWRLESGRSVLLPSSNSTSVPIVSAGHDDAGVNVLGYFDFDQSQGHIARELVAALGAAGVPVAPLNHARSRGSERSERLAAPREARFATNIVVVNADQFEFVVADHGATLLDGRRTVAYWFWELEDVPESFQEAIGHVDEIWTGSQFIADAFGRVTDKPVRCVSLPVAEPEPSDRGRSTMGLPADAYVFVVTFDQFSVPERKNPFGVIESFTRAFTDGEGPVLLVKTVNGAKGWRNHERLLLAAAGRGDIIVWDEHLSRPDQMAVLAAADCLVSLHRSEGLGLHCAEAMWLGKPVIATRYSGNLDFMDDTVAAMIDYELVPVRHGEGIYPETAFWADPDLDQAADWMRRLVADPPVGQALGANARQRMQQQPSMVETGRSIAALAGLDGWNDDDDAPHGGT